MANATNKIRSLFIEHKSVMTLAEIKRNTDLRSNEISMALSHLRKTRWLSREFVKNPDPTNRFYVWEYTYHQERLAK